MSGGEGWQSFQALQLKSISRLQGLNPGLTEWLIEYNFGRQYQSLGYLTPKEFLERYKQNDRKEILCH